ncbi:hypothetical protein Slin15195_G129370 [Septoria linicola]|uniref:Uncharacterized protein n=1 Tax=Septoria linicola TaxID=215465 RepID=A0A9Q9B604_9PEZI|nr:hypothetical protein Slin15195_G129370 [Septoria linicola]
MSTTTTTTSGPRWCNLNAQQQQFGSSTNGLASPADYTKQPLCVCLGTIYRLRELRVVQESAAQVDYEVRVRASHGRTVSTTDDNHIASLTCKRQLRVSTLTSSIVRQQLRQGD